MTLVTAWLSDKIAACKNNAALVNKTAENVVAGAKVVATVVAPAPTAAPKKNDSAATVIALVVSQLVAFVKRISAVAPVVDDECEIVEYDDAGDDPCAQCPVVGCNSSHCK